MWMYMCRIVDDVKLFGGKCRKYFLNCPRIEHTSLKRIIILIFSLRLCFLWQMSQKLELKSCLIYYISIIVISSWQEKLWNWNFSENIRYYPHIVHNCIFWNQPSWNIASQFLQSRDIAESGELSCEWRKQVLLLQTLSPVSTWPLAAAAPTPSGRHLSIN